MRYLFALLLLTGLLPSAWAQGNDAENQFRAVEKRILDAQALQLSFEIERGTKKVRGTLLLATGNKARLTISDGKDKIELVSNGKQTGATGNTAGVFGNKTSWKTPRNFDTLLRKMVILGGVERSLADLSLVLGAEKEVDPASLRRGPVFKAGAA